MAKKTRMLEADGEWAMGLPIWFIHEKGAGFKSEAMIETTYQDVKGVTKRVVNFCLPGKDLFRDCRVLRTVRSAREAFEFAEQHFGRKIQVRS